MTKISQKPFVSLTNTGNITAHCYQIRSYSDVVGSCYERECGCDGDTGCRSEYGKCNVIRDFKITKVNPEYLAECCLRNKDVSHLVRYTTYRIISQSALARKDNWEGDIGRGYYGQELHGYTFSNLKEVERVEQALLQITEDKTEKQLLNIALEFEYGYVLDSLQGKSVTTMHVEHHKIVPVAREHYNRLDRDQVERYVEKYTEKDLGGDEFRKLPVCVVLKDGDTYRLIDGYHRYMAYVRDVGTDIFVIVVE